MARAKETSTALPWLLYSRFEHSIPSSAACGDAELPSYNTLTLIMSPHLLGPHQASLQMVIDIMAKSSIERLPVLIHQLLAALQASRCSIYPCGVRQCKSDTAVTAPILSQYKTLLSSLLSGRKPEGRWVAAVLIKATLEIGNWEMLQSSTPWCRGLLEILTV